MKAVVLGCGPAGLFAAHALNMAGWSVAIWSKKRRSEMYGAQYLHQPIPDLKAVEGSVRYILQGGTTTEYRRKVYGLRGEEMDLTVSPETITPEHHPAWDIRAAYYDAWSLYSYRIVHKQLITGMHLNALAQERPDLIVNSIPRYFLCGNPLHRFLYQQVWAIGDAPERGIFAPHLSTMIPDGYVVCNASSDSAWYRASNMFGYRTVEWSKPPDEVWAAGVKKPLATDCDCNSDLPLLHVGRYGMWKKGVLSHHAFFDLQQYLEQ